MDLVSIIIPVYNGEKTIERTLLSCIKQNHKDIEVLVIDDGSTDKTAEIVKRYLFDERIKYFYQENSERSAARNHGLRLAKGTYVQFLDSDDEIALDKISTHVAHLAENKSTAGIYGPTVYIKNGENHPFQYVRKDRYSSRIWMTNFIPINSMLIKKDSSIKFDESQNYLEDWKYILDFYAKNGPIEPVNFGISIVHIHENNTSNAIQKMRRAHIKMLMEIKCDYSDGNRSASSFQLFRLIGFKDYIRRYGFKDMLRTIASPSAMKLYIDLIGGKLNASKA